LDVEQTTMPPDYLKMARKHLEDLLDTLKNLYRLHRLAESCAAPATTTPTGRPGTPVIGLEAMHVRVLCEQARPTTVFQAHYFPSHTNLVRGVFWQLEDQLGEEPPEIITIVRHHTKGAPCIGEWTVIPLQRLFHPESRIVLFADWLAAKADVMLYDWESACVDCRLNERMAEIRQQRIDPLVLLTIAERKDRRVNSVFLFPDVPAIRDLFARDELAPFDDELRKLLSECAVQVNSAELVCLPWDSLIMGRKVRDEHFVGRRLASEDFCARRSCPRGPRLPQSRPGERGNWKEERNRRQDWRAASRPTGTKGNCYANWAAGS
jgi:hypothetical protein